MKTIDLNCDMGESYGAWKMGDDAGVMPHISSANIACGFHGGDPHVMRKSVELALTHGVAIGAHPGLPDLMGFGRRRMDVSPQEIKDIHRYQVGALWAFVKASGSTLQHVKAHAIQYHMFEDNLELGRASAEPWMACSMVDSLQAAVSHSVDSHWRMSFSVSSRFLPT